MIKFLQLSVAAFLCIYALNATAQTVSRADSLQKVYANKQGKTFFFELLGPGAAYSVNYDVRFKKKPDGWGGRVGISYYAETGDHIFTVPVVVNYLAGKKGKYFEVGAGVTYYSVNTNDVFFSTQYDAVYNNGDVFYTNTRNQSGIIGTLNFGYRYQPLDGGFSLRTGFSPIITSDRFIPWWPYLSLGYAF